MLVAVPLVAGCAKDPMRGVMMNPNDPSRKMVQPTNL
jgi:hypothetical protein